MSDPFRIAYSCTNLKQVISPMCERIDKYDIKNEYSSNSMLADYVRECRNYYLKKWNIKSLSWR